MYCNMKPTAKATVAGNTKYPDIHGEVLFYQQNCAVLVTAKISGLPKNESGFHGFHIHEGKNCVGKDFPNTGGHHNHGDNPHPQHAGDLPPLLACNGSAFLQVRTNRFDVKDIIGKTVIIHENVDNFTTQPSGNAGEKIACGVIQRV